MKYKRHPDRIQWTEIRIPLKSLFAGGQELARRAWRWDRFTIHEVLPGKRYDLFRSGAIPKGSFKSLPAAQAAAEVLEITR